MDETLLAFVSGTWHSFAGVSVWALSVALALHVVKMAAEARSWHEIVNHVYRTVPVPFRITFGAFVGAIGANAILPARVGEALRVGIVRHGVEGSRVVTIAATIALETALEVLFGIAIVITWLVGGGSVGGRGSLIHGMPGFISQPLVWIVAGVALPMVVAIAFHYRERMRRLATSFAEGFSIVRSPGTFARRVVSWKVVAWVLRFATVVAFLMAFHIPAALWTALVVVAAQTVAGALPLIPGNAGTQQAAIAVALAGTASAATLLGFGVGMQATTTVVDLAVGVAALTLVPRNAQGHRHMPWHARRLPGEPERLTA